MTRTADLLVVGGGLHGLSAALHSARQGVRTIVVERDFVGRHASGATAAGVRTLGRDPAELPLSLEAAETWRNIAALVDDDCGFRKCGQLQVAETDAAFATIAARVRGLEAQGMRHEELLGPEALRSLMPGIPAHCRGAAWAPGDGSADPHRTLRAFRGACRAAGVEIEEGCAVTAMTRRGGVWRVETTRGPAEATIVLIAAGAWSGRVAAMAGEVLDQRIRTSMMIVTERAEPRVGPVVGSLGQRLSFKQTAEGTLLIGGGTQGRLAPDANSARVDARALAHAALAAVRLFPWTAGLRVVRSWAGMEAQTADQLPVLGPSPTLDGIIYAFGFSGHGFQLVPSVGRLIASVVTGEPPTHDLTPFAAERVRGEAGL